MKIRRHTEKGKKANNPYKAFEVDFYTDEKKYAVTSKAVLKQEKRLVGLLCSRDLFKNKGGIIHI
jgi:hypothetical protein